MKLIPLTGGIFSMVDDEDYERISELCSWYVFKHGRCFYARGGVYDREFYVLHKKKRIKHKSIHREVMRLKDSKISIDHIDGDGLNNQKSNLRICNQSQNMGNKSKKLNSSSRFKGVFLNEKKKFIASIGFNGKTKRIGQYDSEIEAALAYNVAASFKYREFAKLNIISL